MIRHCLVAVGWLFIAGTALAQHTSIHAGVGFGSYQMNDVRQVQNSFDAAAAPLAIKRTDDLGPSPYYDFQFRIYTKRDFFTGLVFRRMSSGIRSVYEDYSGKIELRQKVEANCLGFLAATKLHVKSPLQVNSGIELYAAWESYEFYYQEEYTSTPPYVENGSASNQSFHANLFLEALYPFGSWSAGLKAGYTADPLSKDLKLDWTGWRLGLYLSCRLTAQ